MQYQASLRVPDSWKYGTALPIDRESGNDVDFKPASLTTLVDSPLSTGRHYRTVGIGTDNGIPHYVHFAGDSESGQRRGRRQPRIALHRKSGTDQGR